MCSPNGGGEEEKLVLKTSSGEIVDSISAAEGEPENFTTLVSSYSEADKLFTTGNVTQAKPLYEQIVSGNYTAEENLLPIISSMQLVISQVKMRHTLLLYKLHLKIL